MGASTTPGAKPDDDAVVVPRRRPRVFGDYELLAPLAEGGMGAVWLARRRGFAPDVQRFCAVKTVLRSLSAQAEFQRRFRDEARVVVTLNHRALCHVFDVGIVDGESYLAMELVEGASLAQLVSSLKKRGESLPLEVALAIADEVGDALAHVHERRDPVTGAPLAIVHRDISPQNILVTFQGAVKVIDFGVVSSALRQERTAAGLVIGKLNYMAPEQARGEPARAATDVYSAGVVIWELVTGRRFWGELDKGVVMMELCDGSWRPPFDDVPAALHEVLRAALEPDPAARLQDGGALQRALALVELPRARPHVVRELVARVLAPEQERLTELLRSVASVPAVLAGEPTKVMRLASASSSPASGRSDLPSTTDGAPIRDGEAPFNTRSPFVDDPHEAATVVQQRPSDSTRRLPGVAVAALTIVVVVMGIVGAWALTRPPTPPAPLLSTTPLPPVAVPPTMPAPPAPTTPAPVLPPPTTPTPVLPPPTTPPTTTTAPARTRPPLTPLPDLGAELAYLQRHCVGRVTCAAPLVAEQRRMAVLDAAGLRALREQAGRCVARCRR